MSKPKQVTHIITVYDDGSVDITPAAGTTPQTFGGETPPKTPPHP